MEHVKESRKMNPFLIGCIIAGATGLGITVLIGGLIAWFLISASYGPSGGVKMSNDMEKYALEYIEKNKLLNDKEIIIAYYDATISLDGSESAILTDERIFYHKNGGTTSIDLKDIQDVDHSYETITGDVIIVKSKKGPSLKIEIAPLNQGDLFYKMLLDTWKSPKNGN